MLRIMPFKIRKWFPPGDPVATAVAMLCILREDFFLELQGIVADDLGRLDDNEAAFRRLYFWRNSVRTLEEIKHPLNRLISEAEFRAMLAREPAETRETVDRLRKELNKTSDAFLRQIRNSVGGHLDAPTVQAGLDNMDHDQEAMAQFATSRGGIRYRFALDVLWLSIFHRAPGRQKTEDPVNGMIGDTSRLMFIVEAIDAVVSCYLRGRRHASV